MSDLEAKLTRHPTTKSTAARASFAHLMHRWGAVEISPDEVRIISMDPGRFETWKRVSGRGKDAWYELQ